MELNPLIFREYDIRGVADSDLTDEMVFTLGQGFGSYIQEEGHNEALVVVNGAKADALNTIAEPVPFHLRNPVTKLMGRLGYGKGYKYPHNYPRARVDQQYLPEGLRGRRYYHPTDRGLEGEFKKRLRDRDAG